MRRRPYILAPAVVVAGVALVAAGCGGGGGSPQVANLGTNAAGTTPASTTESSSQAPPGKLGTPGGSHGGQFQIGMNVGTKDGPKFSACMRKHGITNFPDPSSQGVISIHSGMGIDPNSPAFQSARSACAKLLPNGGQPTPAQIAQQQQKLLVFASCMRAHGLKDFPDPSGGGLRLSVHPGSDLSPDNPTFKKAQQACGKYLPFKGAQTGSGTLKGSG
jgi:hypothetical protein